MRERERKEKEGRSRGRKREIEGRRWKERLGSDEVRVADLMGTTSPRMGTAEVAEAQPAMNARVARRQAAF